jgi:hypothetical protein
MIAAGPVFRYSSCSTASSITGSSPTQRFVVKQSGYLAALLPKRAV